MVKPNEFQILMLALAFTPLLIWGYAKITARQKILAAAGLMAILGAYILTIAEGFVAPVLMNTLEHVFYAVAGVCFAVTAVGAVAEVAAADEPEVP